MTEPPSRPEARRRFGPESANELGAPVASSTPEQLPGHEPASARVFFMAAMSASNWNPLLKRFHDRLAATGKLPKVVIVAVMRKMITTLNAMVRDDVVWADRHRGRHTVPTTR